MVVQKAVVETHMVVTWSFAQNNKEKVYLICSKCHHACQQDIMLSFIIPVLINIWLNQSSVQKVWISIMSQVDIKKYLQHISRTFTSLVWSWSATVHCFYFLEFFLQRMMYVFLPLPSLTCLCHLSVCAYYRSGPITRRNQSRRLCMYPRRRNEWPTTEQYMSPKSATPCTSTPRT